jgi:hypothetical protein
MDNFYIIVVVVAVVFLILCLVAVGMSLQTSGATAPFPKLQAPCPDGWGKDSDGSCIQNPINIGSRTGPTLGPDEINVWSSLSSNKFTANPNATICDKRKWAIAKGINWDGVSNYNQCV